MPLRRLALIALPLLLIGVGGCQNAMVSLGLKEEPPPVTNADYFSIRTRYVYEQLRSNQSKPIRKAAVLDFANPDGRISELGRFLTLKFQEQALADKGFKVVPDGQVREALTRLAIPIGKPLTREQVQTLSIDLGADTLITGVVSDLQKGADVDLTVKAVSSPGGDLVSAASVSIYRSKQVQSLVQTFVAGQ